jgi:prolyl 4-hydroxylase
MIYYILFFVLFVIILFLLWNNEKIKYVIERQGFADKDSEYVEPVIINNFITNEQNLNILEYAKTKFHPSVVGGGLSNKVDNLVRNSETAWVPKTHPIANEIIMKVCRQNNYPFENAEDLQVVKYEKGDYYREHHDSFPLYDPAFLSQGGHRVLTTLIYLNDDFEDGETRFVNLDKNIKPRKNSAIVFHPLDAENKRCHPNALHAGLPIKSGKKYIANIWIREEQFNYTVNVWGYDHLFNSFIVYTYSIINSIINANNI